MLDSFSEFDDIHKSFLQELGNMGAGNAATEVSNMVSTPTDISTPQVRINPPVLAGIAVDKLCSQTETFKIDLCGDMKGSLLFVFPYPCIERVVSTFFPDKSVKEKSDIDEMTESTVRETVNIAAASYANNLSQMTGLFVDISVPQAVEKPSKELEQVKQAAGNSVCSVKNTIEFLDCHNTFDVLFYPELNSIKNLMGTLGLLDMNM